MDLKNIKILGGIGGILYLLSFIPYIGLILFIAGLVLIFIAMYKISQYAPERKIFSNFLIAFIVGIVGGLIGSFIGVGSLLYSLETSGETGISLGMIFGFILIYITMIVSGYFYNKAFSSTSELLNQNLFKLGGQFIFWGSIATIILLGLVIIWVGWLLITIAFFSLPDTFSTEKTKEQIIQT